jgi:hypothetical protein
MSRTIRRKNGYDKSLVTLGSVYTLDLTDEMFILDSPSAIWLTVRYSGKLAEQKSAWYHREIPKGWYGSKRYRQVLNRARRAQEKQELRRIAQGDRERGFPLWRRGMVRIRADEW